MFKEENNDKAKKPTKSEKPALGDVKDSENEFPTRKNGIKVNTEISSTPKVSESVMPRRIRSRKVCEVNGHEQNSKSKIKRVKK